MRTKPQKLQRGKGVAVLLFGFPGAGKTPFIGTQPRTLILRPPTDHTDAISNPSNCREMVIRDWASELEAYQYVHQGGYEEYDWVWLDSLSVFQDFGLRDVLQDAIDRKPTRSVTKGEGPDGKAIKVPEFGADQGEYGINMTRITNMVQDFVGMADEGKINFGVVCHPEVWYNPMTEESILAPWVQGRGMIPKICGYMNMICYMTGEPKPVLYSEAKGFFGKDQYGAIPKLKSGKRGLVRPTMPKLISLLEAQRETPAEAAAREAEETKPKRAKKKKVKKVRKV